MRHSIVIYGPPGTGKTTRLTRMIQEYIDSGVNPAKIGVVSFTKAAAKEIATRTGHPTMPVATLHSFAYRQAEIVKDQVVNYEWFKLFAQHSKIQISGTQNYEIEELGEGDAYMSLYSYGRSILSRDWEIIFRNAPTIGNLPKFKYFVSSYEDFKDKFGVVDFSDMLDMALGLAPELEVLVLDEAQDFTPQQWRLIESWLPDIDVVIVAGDDDQAIYKWNGADPEGMRQFEKKHQSERIILDQSYRIPKAVHSLANILISRVRSRVQKSYLPREFEGSVQRYGDARLVKFDPNIDTLVLVRNHSLRTEIELAMMQRGVPYISEGGKPAPLNSPQARAVRLWLLAQKTDGMITDAQERQITRHLKAIYKNKPFEKLLAMSWMNALELPKPLLHYLSAIEGEYGHLPLDPKIRISTIHGSKGREADRVILVNGMSQRTYESQDTDSEIRTFYVGITRAKQELIIVSADNGIHL